MFARPDGAHVRVNHVLNRGPQIMVKADSANPDTPPWRTASMCNGGSCIKVAPWGDMVLLGDTKSPDAPVLSYTHSEWNEFISRIKRGEYQGY